jgi:quinol monooxygenase YgiN
MSDHVIVLAENDIHAGQLENLKALITEMVEYIQREEPGTLNYEWFIDDEGKTAHAYERYADSESCIAHLTVARQIYGERLFSYLTITKITVYGNPSEPLREIFGPYAGTYRSRFGGVAR